VKTGGISTTALRVAAARAAHQFLDVPPVFVDPLAIAIVGGRDSEDLQAYLDRAATNAATPYLRALLAARSRCAEDALAGAVRHDVRQYVVLGAGLDTFAYRNPYHGLRVFEVDWPAMQALKRERLARATLAIPDSLTFVPIDFETQTLGAALAAGGLDAASPAFFSWLGVTPYLTREALLATLRTIGSMARGSGVTFDYAPSPDSLDPERRKRFDAVAARVAAAGEPFKTFIEPEDLARELRGLGFTALDDLGPAAINARYFADRADGLKIGGLAHVMTAWI